MSQTAQTSRPWPGLSPLVGRNTIAKVQPLCWNSSRINQRKKTRTVLGIRCVRKMSSPRPPLTMSELGLSVREQELPGGRAVILYLNFYSLLSLHILLLLECQDHCVSSPHPFRKKIRLKDATTISMRQNYLNACFPFNSG